MADRTIAGWTLGPEEIVDFIRKRLSNSEDPWLSTFDGADDPRMDVSQYYPTGNRGTVILTPRNPDFKIHNTVDSIGIYQMKFEEATTLLLKSAALDDVSHEASRCGESGSA